MKSFSGGDSAPFDARSSNRRELQKLELQIGRSLVNIWFDADGIHFGPRDGESAEGLLPWDVAMAMSLIPDTARRPVRSSAA